MNKNKDLLREIPFFISIYSFFIFVGMTLLAYYGKDNLHLNLNQYYSSFSDLFFKYYTDIAVNGVLFFLIIYIFLRKTWFEMSLLIIPYILGSVINSIIKRSFFVDVHRPTYYFELKKIPLHLVEGVQSQIPYTFPSGHTLNAFIFFALLSLIIKKKALQILFVCLAILVAMSRVYLSKHFALDTMGGSLLGMMLFAFTYYFLQNKNHPFLAKKCNLFIKKS